MYALEVVKCIFGRQSSKNRMKIFSTLSKNFCARRCSILKVLQVQLFTWTMKVQRCCTLASNCHYCLCSSIHCRSLVPLQVAAAAVLAICCHHYCCCCCFCCCYCCYVGDFLQAVVWIEHGVFYFPKKRNSIS